MTREKGYQFHFSRGDSVLEDIEGRTRKFKKILSVLQDFRPSTRSLKCLDVGCSNGIITSHLGGQFLIATGIDIDREAVKFAREHFLSPQVQFLIGDAMVLPFGDNSIDVIVCNQVYEHVPKADRLMEEIYRVLSNEGFCYFAAGNKYAIMEGHYYLPFLSWIPKPLADLYLRCTRKGSSYYEDHLSLDGLKQLVKRFKIHDYTLSIILNPGKFSATDIFDTRSFFYKAVRWLAPYVYRWIPTYVWVLTKK